MYVISLGLSKCLEHIDLYAVVLLKTLSLALHTDNDIWLAGSYKMNFNSILHIVTTIGAPLGMSPWKNLAREILSKFIDPTVRLVGSPSWTTMIKRWGYKFLKSI